MNEQDQSETAAPSPGAASLEAEANAALLGAPEVAATPGDEPDAEFVQAAGQPWGPFLQTAIAPIAFGVLVPQWEFSPEEKTEFVAALGECCDQIFPGGPAGKYACWVRLILGGASMVGVRMLKNGGKPLPFGPKLIAQPVAGDGAQAA